MPLLHTQTETGTETSTNRPLLLDHLINPVLGQGVWTDLLLRDYRNCQEGHTHTQPIII